jgi:hypothetical protein
MIFCGEVVVICWWERGFWLVFFGVRKMSLAEDFSVEISAQIQL